MNHVLDVTQCFRAHTRVHILNGISIGSAILRVIHQPLATTRHVQSVQQIWNSSYIFTCSKFRKNDPKFTKLECFGQSSVMSSFNRKNTTSCYNRQYLCYIKNCFRDGDTARYLWEITNIATCVYLAPALEVTSMEFHQVIWRQRTGVQNYHRRWLRDDFLDRNTGLWWTDGQTDGHWAISREPIPRLH